jgi:hypothetical protein
VGGGRIVEVGTLAFERHCCIVHARLRYGGVICEDGSAIAIVMVVLMVRMTEASRRLGEGFALGRTRDGTRFGDPKDLCKLSLASTPGSRHSPFQSLDRLQGFRSFLRARGVLTVGS